MRQRMRATYSVTEKHTSVTVWTAGGEHEMSFLVPTPGTGYLVRDLIEIYLTDRTPDELHRLAQLLGTVAFKFAREDTKFRILEDGAADFGSEGLTDDDRP
jgi:hypothetical protein